MKHRNNFPEKCLQLWRPVGNAELRLIEQSGWERFPPRLPEQPIFYPVLNFEYAEKIARDWNSTDAGHNYQGYVVAFQISSICAAKYPVQVAGGRDIKELWVPAEELDYFNNNIVSKIDVVATYERGLRIEPNP